MVILLLSREHDGQVKFFTWFKYYIQYTLVIQIIKLKKNVKSIYYYIYIMNIFYSINCCMYIIC